MEFQDFKNLIQEEYIDTVLKLYFPEVVHIQKYKGRYHPRYELGIKTKHCNFLFIWGEGAGCMIGPLTSSFQDAQNGWYGLDRITSFVTQQPFNYSPLKQTLSHREQLMNSIYQERREFKPVAEKIMLMFSSKKNMNKWQEMYLQYENEQFRTKYPKHYDHYLKRKK
ncbi:MAG: hypothetical protein HN390_10730 [Anaerolineae bacterium]|jgi:hypothetical protein|nr:hypothetical protein [Anaerolineae bacterium]MBT7188616.1 hypothetical protein [Anaerolineae bacterium]MBT7989741.1 hypothetical protein [Anaerolineae bacterium]